MSGMEKETARFGHFDGTASKLCRRGPGKRKNHLNLKGFKWFCYGAAIQIRTGDLILTKDALYQLSYSSKWRPGSGSNRRPPA